ncbi:MAG: serine/threonine-protein phosphatase [Bacteroidetes bacterium]|nr:serine/threonine-protein phosphatase [Bacteroidota bacterium]
MLKISCEFISDKGCVRENNEDMILLNGEFYRDEHSAYEFSMGELARVAAMVADGMGGHAGGEFASELALRSFDEFLTKLPPTQQGEYIIAAVKDWALQAHAFITRKGQELPAYSGMGTTFVGMFFYEDKIFKVNIGDSRLYRYRDHFLKQLTEDHSMRNLTHDISVNPNLIYNCLGAGGSVFADVEEITDKIVTDDCYVICSDGLSDMLSDESIAAILDRGGSAANLVNAAKDAGGKDNVSVILLHFTE